MNDRIKKIRKDAGLTQEQFAKRLGVKRNTVATYEMGRSTPIDAAITSICREFGVNEEDVHHIQGLLHQTSVQNKEFSVQIKAQVENKRQMYKLKLHTLWSSLKKDEYIEIIGYFDTI